MTDVKQPILPSKCSPRGRGRMMSRGWLEDFKPNPPPFTVEELSKSLNEYSDSIKDYATSKNQTINTIIPNTTPDDEKPPTQNIQGDTSKTFRNILQKAVNANVFVPTAFNIPSYSEDEASIPDEKPALHRTNSNSSSPRDFLRQLSDHSDDEKAEIFLQDYIMTLTENPGEFQSIIREISPSLSELKSEESVKAIIRIIFDHATNNTNFCYTAARFFEYFDRKKTFGEASNFRKIFYTKCQSEFKWLSEITSGSSESRPSASDYTKMTNIAFFFGELFNNMKVQDKPNAIFKKCVFDIVDMFLKSKEERLVRCLVKLLKLSGPELDRERPKDVETMFDKVRDFYIDSNTTNVLPEEVRKSIWAVYKLHTRDWDRSTSPVSPIPTSPRFPTYPKNNVWINPKLLEERNRKLSSGSTVDWNDFYMGDDSELAGFHSDGGQYHDQGSSTEDEALDDYEEFLRQTGQI